MTRKTSFITALGAALVLALPTTGLAKQGGSVAEAPGWYQALEIRGQGLNKLYGLGEYSHSQVDMLNARERSFEAKSAVAETPEWYQALEIRGQGLNKRYGLGEYSHSQVDMLNARERSLDARAQVESSSMLDSREESFTAKREAQLSGVSGPDAFERTVIASTRETPPIVADDRFRLDATSGGETAPVQTTSSREIEWPQVGIGLGIGVLLMIGLYLALKGTRQRPLAH